MQENLSLTLLAAAKAERPPGEDMAEAEVEVKVKQGRAVIEFEFEGL